VHQRGDRAVEAERVVRVLVQRPPRQLLGELDGERPVLADAVRHLLRGGQQRLRRHHPAHQPDLPRARRVDALAGEEHLHRHRHRDGGRQPHRPEAVEDRPAHLRAAERRGLGRDADVAAEGQLEPPGEAVAVDRGDHRLRDLEPLAEPVLDLRPPQLVDAPGVRAAVHLLEIGAGAERLVARAGDDRDAERVVAVELLEPTAQLAGRRQVECVHGLGPVQRDPDHGALGLVENGAHRSSPI
jgi:hypothetical protein